METQDSTTESYSEISPPPIGAVADSDSHTEEYDIVCTENSAYQFLSLEHPPQQTSMFSSMGHFNQDMKQRSFVEAAIAQNGDEEEENSGDVKENPACMQQNSEDKVS